jgi:hypothetical protein
MKIEILHVGMKVRHPQYGFGSVRAVNERTAEIRFDDGVKTVEPEAAGMTPAEPQAALSGLEVPLQELIERTVEALAGRLGLEKPAASVAGLGARWHGGLMVMHPKDPALQTKEVPMEVFFHKIVMIRNNLRVLEQKINANDRLNDGEKLELQQYVTRCYGSMTTFNLLFRDKGEQFGGSSGDV